MSDFTLMQENVLTSNEDCAVHMLITYDFCFSMELSTQSYERPFDEAGIIICAIIIFFLLFVGFFANLLTMAVIVTYKELK